VKKERFIQSRVINNTIIIAVISTFLGLFYPLLSREFDHPMAFLNGALVGLIGGIFIALNEQDVFRPKIKKSSFLKKLITKSLTYMFFFSLLFLGVVSFTRSLESGLSWFEYLSSSHFYSLVFYEDFHIGMFYILLLSGTISFARQMSRKMGQGVLLNIITGKYRKPIEEERIFMFMDINSSTEIAEKLGDIKYNELLNEFFYDVTVSILATKGEIYRYVGDEIVVSWNMKAGLKNSNCIRTFFLALNEINKEKEKYYNRYNLVPRFSAGFHCGKVIRGEIGDVKSQIVFHGEVMYTSVRTEKKCGELKKRILITSNLMKKLSIPDIYEMVYVGKLEAKDNQRELDLYTVNEVEVPPI